MSDIVKNLRQGKAGYQSYSAFVQVTPTHLEAANEIERLQAENARLREALDFYGDVSKYPAPFTGGMGALWEDCGKIARAARGEKE
jgi:hypothetical protein